MKRIQITLSIVGALILIFGVSMVVTDAAAYWANLSAPQAEGGAYYVGSAACFTCHEEDHPEWEIPQHPIIIRDQMAYLQTGLTGIPEHESIRQMAVVGETRAYTVEDLALSVDTSYHQSYLMQTEDGVTVLPGEWSLDDDNWNAAKSSDWLMECAGCHPTGFQESAQPSMRIEVAVNCEDCHGPASEHVKLARALQQPNTDPDMDAVRASLISTVNMALCTYCHAEESAPLPANLANENLDTSSTVDPVQFLTVLRPSGAKGN